jgi:hypothetical protein
MRSYERPTVAVPLWQPCSASIRHEDEDKVVTTPPLLLDCIHFFTLRCSQLSSAFVCSFHYLLLRSYDRRHWPRLGRGRFMADLRADF